MDFENYYKEFLQRKADKDREKEKEISVFIGLFRKSLRRIVCVLRISKRNAI